MGIVTRTLSVTASFALAAVALSGCASPLLVNTQTVEEACELLKIEIQAYSETADSAMKDAVSIGNEQGIIEAAKDMLNQYDALGKRISNSEVREPFSEVVAIMWEMIPVMEKFAADPSAQSILEKEYYAIAERATVAGEDFNLICPDSDVGLIG